MQRYFIKSEQLENGMAAISGDDAHHLTHVLRAKPGDKILICDGTGRTAEAEIAELSPQLVAARIMKWLEADASEPVVDVWIAQSLPKADKMEWVVQKGTEAGAAGFWPFRSERTVVQYDAKKESKRLDRWRKIIKEAAEQAHRGRLPEIAAARSWAELLKKAAEADMAFVCYEKASGIGIKTALKEAVKKLNADPAGYAARKPSAAVIVGPEGGFTKDEIRQAEAAGVQAVGLGPRILRTETAALVALSCILYEFGEMGGDESCRL